MKYCLPVLLFCIFCQPTLAQDSPVVVSGETSTTGRILSVDSVPSTGNSITALNDGSHSKIFVELWRLDQQHNGLSVTTRGADGRWENFNAALGLDEQSISLNPRDDSAPRPMMELLDSTKLSRRTYTTVRKLFDNYNVRNGQSEDQIGDNALEDAEVNAFIDAIVTTEVMKRCLAYANEQALKPGGGEYSTEDFQSVIRHQWFRTFTNHYSQPNPDCSGFEHVFVGDSDGSKIGGHHFWWKFLLDQQSGVADSLGHKYLGPAGETYPILATFRMRWTPEPGSTLRNPVQKGFFVGCSPELMIAYGTLGLLVEQKTGHHPLVTLDGGRFEMTVHASTLAGPGDPDRRRGDQIRTAYPKLLSLVGGSGGQTVDVGEALALETGKRVHVSGVVRAEHNNEFGLQLAASESGDGPFLAVKLPSTFRSLFNPQLNPSVKGKAVVVHGRRDRYTGIPGVVDVTHIELTE